MAGEILSAQLNSLHNLYFYHQIMKRCREALGAGRLDCWLLPAEAGVEP